MTKTYNVLYVAIFCDPQRNPNLKNTPKTTVLCEYPSTQEYIKRHTMQNYTLGRVQPEERCLQRYSQSRRPHGFPALPGTIPPLHRSTETCPIGVNGSHQQGGPPETILYGSRQSGGFVNNTVKCYSQSHQFLSYQPFPK